MTIAGAGRIAAIAANAARDNGVARRSDDTAPVSVIAPVERPPVWRSAPRHDALFVTQLIAMAQHSPQTRVLRRAAPQVAHAAYHSASERNPGSAQTSPRLLRVI
ncbi:hypothetical protein V4R08_09285 [Nitrobacter sp. NHB1]|uniref:hypothetical protein n=1 Tax=Nitrobacter sp. NHB1 TaxID=3119830 RepID=UPI002FFE865D